MKKNLTDILMIFGNAQERVRAEMQQEERVISQPSADDLSCSGGSQPWRQREESHCFLYKRLPSRLLRGSMEPTARPL